MRLDFIERVEAPAIRRVLGRSAACALLLLASWPASSQSGGSVFYAPFDLRASHTGSRQEGTWHLAIRSPGRSELVTVGRGYERKNPCDTPAEPLLPADPSIRIPPARLAELREAIRREGFFELGQSYGAHVVDGSERSIEIRDGSAFNKITLYSVWPDEKMSNVERGEIARALRVWIAIRNCFYSPQALDSRREDREFLKAAGVPCKVGNRCH